MRMFYDSYIVCGYAISSNKKNTFLEQLFWISWK